MVEPLNLQGLVIMLTSISLATSLCIYCLYKLFKNQ
jgi:hypothetical protein